MALLGSGPSHEPLQEQPHRRPGISLDFANMVSVDQHTFTMLPRHMSEEHEQYGSLYPDPPHGPFSAVGIDLGLTSDAYYPRFTQDLPTTMSGFEQIPFAFDGPAGWSSFGGRMSPPMFQEDREMGLPSNISTASVPSAPSSAVGSPRSTHGQPAPMPEWAHQGVAMGSPGIVSHEYFTGTEYSFAPQGMEDIAPFAYAETSKPPGFVGELPQTPRSVAPQHPQRLQQQTPGLISPSVSRRESSCTFSSESGPASDTPPEALYAQAAMLPVSPQSSRKSSVMLSEPPSTSLSSPTAHAWTSPTTPLVSPFFSQSSGHFIAPLGSSCWFP